MANEFNVNVYSEDRVVEFYRHEIDLHPAEEYLLRNYASHKSDIIDVGVGAGRTTPFLSKISLRYLGVDSSQAMIDVCMEQFRNLTSFVSTQQICQE